MKALALQNDVKIKNIHKL